MIAKTLTLLAEPSPQSLDHPIDGGPELGPVTATDDRLRPVDMYDDFDLLRVLLFGIHDIGGRRTRLVLRERFDLNARPLANLVGDAAMPLRELDPQLNLDGNGDVTGCPAGLRLLQS